jgi:hypothetical protein
VYVGDMRVCDFISMYVQKDVVDSGPSKLPSRAKPPLRLDK